VATVEEASRPVTRGQLEAETIRDRRLADVAQLERVGVAAAAVDLAGPLDLARELVDAAIAGDLDPLDVHPARVVDVVEAAPELAAEDAARGTEVAVERQQVGARPRTAAIRVGGPQQWQRSVCVAT